MDLRPLDPAFMLELFESLIWFMVWLVAAVFAVEFLCVVALALGGAGRAGASAHENTHSSFR
jgi:hypothetical protein